MPLPQLERDSWLRGRVGIKEEGSFVIFWIMCVDRPGDLFPSLCPAWDYSRN